MVRRRGPLGGARTAHGGPARRARPDSRRWAEAAFARRHREQKPYSSGIRRRGLLGIVLVHAQMVVIPSEVATGAHQPLAGLASASARRRPRARLEYGGGFRIEATARKKCAATIAKARLLPAPTSSVSLMCLFTRTGSRQALRRRSTEGCSARSSEDGGELLPGVLDARVMQTKDVIHWRRPRRRRSRMSPMSLEEDRRPYPSWCAGAVGDGARRLPRPRANAATCAVPPGKDHTARPSGARCAQARPLASGRLFEPFQATTRPKETSRMRRGACEPRRGPEWRQRSPDVIFGRSNLCRSRRA